MNHLFHSFDNISDVLPLNPARIISIVGAGGKTTLMEQLANTYASHEKKVLFTTTTHILRPEHLPKFYPVISEDKETLQSFFLQGQSVCLGIPCSIFHGKEKWKSPSQSFFQSIKALPDIVLCEGDGSRRLPVKMPKETEPVFFPGTDTVIGIIGLSCLGQPIKKAMYGFSENIDILKKYFPMISEDTIIDIDLLSFLASSPHGLYKGCYDKNYLVILNQADTLSKKNLDSIRELGSRLKSRNISCHILSLKEQFEIKMDMK